VTLPVRLRAERSKLKRRRSIQGLCSAKIRWGRRIMYFQGFHLPKVSLRIVAQVSITP
jgi:hypothetical protein